jgi:hypothetical protein
VTYDPPLREPQQDRTGTGSAVDGQQRQVDPPAGFSDATLIARGARASVLRARDTTSGQLVAVKVLEGAADRAPDRAAFEREARALGAVSRHPNVVTLHRAYLDEDGRPLLVLELCDGSLADRLAEEGPLTIRDVVAAGVALAGALETAHRSGIVHGDLTPRSVLVTRYGEVALADFGVAALHDAASEEGAGRGRGVLDTARTAPEVLRGEAPTPVSDVHDLAATLWELLTGRAPYAPDGAEDPRPGASPERGSPPRLELPGAPAALAELLERSLSADPTRRPATALELAQHLRTIEQAAGWGTTACRVGEADSSWGSPLDAGPVASRRGRAAAMTGLPPLQLGTAPLSGGAPYHGPERRRVPRVGPVDARREAEPTPGAWRPPDTAVVRQDLPAPTSDSHASAMPETPAQPPPTGPPVDLPPPSAGARPTDLPPPATSGDVTPAAGSRPSHGRGDHDPAPHDPDDDPRPGDLPGVPSPDRAPGAPHRTRPLPRSAPGPHDVPDEGVEDRR